MGVVVVGAGHAGVEVADALRRVGYHDDITLVDSAPHLPYQRPPLSKDYVQPDAEARPLPLRAERFFTDHGIELRLGHAVTAIDRDGRVVALADGSELAYHDLVLATGAVGRSPRCSGDDLRGVHYLRNLDDAERIRIALGRARRVAVVGAGFIGLEFASVAQRSGLPVTVLDYGQRPMQRVLSEPASEHFRALHEEAGATLIFGEALARLDGDGGDVVAVVGTSGKRYEADLVLLGLGVTPAVLLAEAADIAVDDGVVVDQFLRTSDPHVYAIGDCASCPSRYTGHRIRLESVQNATGHARCAAQSIVGDAQPYEAVPWFWTVQCGHKLQIAGLARPGMTTLVRGDLKVGKASVLGFEDDQLVCVESLDAPADHMAARQLLTAGQGPTPVAVVRPDFSLKEFAQQLRTAQ